MHQMEQRGGRFWLDQDDRWTLGLCLARVAFTLIFTTYAATQPLLMIDWHMSASQAGWIHSSFYLGYLISLVGVGFLVDRYGAKRIILLSSVAAAGGAFLFAVFGLVLDWFGSGRGETFPLAWGLAFASLGVGGLLGPLGMLRLRKMPESANLAGGLR